MAWKIWRLAAKFTARNPGVKSKFCFRSLRHKRIYACFLGVSAKFTTRNPGASAKFPTAKLTTANLIWHHPPVGWLCWLGHPHGGLGAFLEGVSKCIWEGKGYLMGAVAKGIATVLLFSMPPERAQEGHMLAAKGWQVVFCVHIAGQQPP